MEDFIINKDIKRVPVELVDRFKRLHPSTLGHLRDGIFLTSLRPNKRPIRIVGSALTVRIPHLDSTAVHLSLDVAQPGDVIVVSMSGDYSRACWGGMVSYAAAKKAIAGAIIDGCICDVEEILSLDFPVFSRGISPLTTRILGIEGEIGYTVAIDGVPINSGDLVFADDDGVAILSQQYAEQIADILESIENGENETKRKIDSGIPLSEISGAARFLKKRKVSDTL